MYYIHTDADKSFNNHNITIYIIT